MDQLPPLDERALRNAFGHFATGVAVVTASAADGLPLGMTITSFNTVSLDPPLILFSIRRASRSITALSNARGYAVNILRSDQMELSGRFARSEGNRWEGVSYKAGLHGAPLLERALMTLECQAEQEHDGGDHVIFLGRLLRVGMADQGDPLLFFRGRYHSAIPHDLPTQRTTA
jgi:flavin reductase (DIM6/NTAB) family NADH-FMN oxidoreductase RutF